MANNFTYNLKELPSTNYPLRKVNAFVRRVTPKHLHGLMDAIDKPILNAVEPIDEGFKTYLNPATGKPVAGTAEAALQESMNRNRNTVTPGTPGMRKGGKVKKYANGGGIPKPPKGKKYDAAANDWMAGKMEADAAKERKKAKPAPKPKNPNAPDWIPGANYEKEFDSYVDHINSKGKRYTPRTSPGFSPRRNDTDLAAQSVVDQNMDGIKPKRQGGGPGQRPGINMIDNLKRYAKGGSIDGCAQRGKTKGRFV